MTAGGAGKRRSAVPHFALLPVECDDPRAELPPQYRRPRAWVWLRWVDLVEDVITSPTRVGWSVVEGDIEVQSFYFSDADMKKWLKAQNRKS